MAHAEKCPVCGGSGRICSNVYDGPPLTSVSPYDKPCHGCDGKGWVTVPDGRAEVIGLPDSPHTHTLPPEWSSYSAPSALSLPEISRRLYCPTEV